MISKNAFVWKTKVKSKRKEGKINSNMQTTMKKTVKDNNL